MTALAAVMLAVCLLVLLGVTKPAKATFSGKNDKIVFVSNRSGNDEIYTICFTGDNLARLAHNSIPDDGKTLVFERGRDLYTMNAKATHKRKVPNVSFYNYFGGRLASFGGNPAFSPGGGKTIFDKEKNPTNNSARDMLPDWQPIQ